MMDCSGLAALCGFDLSIPDAWKIPQEMVKRAHFMASPPLTDLFLSPSKDHQ